MLGFPSGCRSNSLLPLGRNDGESGDDVAVVVTTPQVERCGQKGGAPILRRVAKSFIEDKDGSRGKDGWSGLAPAGTTYSCHYSGSRAGEEERVQIGEKPGEAAQRRVPAEQVQPSSMGVD